MDIQSTEEGGMGTESSLEQDAMTLHPAHQSTAGKQSSEDEMVQNLAKIPNDPASIAESVLVSDSAVASAAQRALGLIEIVDVIASHIAQGFGGSGQAQPDVLRLMHVNQVWRAAAKPFLLREIVVYGPLADGGHETARFGTHYYIPLRLLLRNVADLLHHTTSLDFGYGYGCDSTHSQHFAYGFELLTKCTHLRRLILFNPYIRAWSRLKGRPLASLPYLRTLSLECNIDALSLVAIDISSLSNLNDIDLSLDADLILDAADVDLDSVRRSIAWLGRLFAVCSASLKRVAVRVILAPRSLHRLHLSEVWSTIRPHLEQITRLSLDFPRLFDGMTALGPLDDLPDSLEELYLCCQPQNVQPVIERLRDPTYLPNLATIPYIHLQSFCSPPLDRELVKQAIQGLKARKCMKWKKGDKFMDIPMDFDEQAGQGDVE